MPAKTASHSRLVRKDKKMPWSPEAEVGDEFQGIINLDSLKVRGGAKGYSEDPVIYDFIDINNGEFSDPLNGIQTGSIQSPMSDTRLAMAGKSGVLPQKRSGPSPQMGLASADELLKRIKAQRPIALKHQKQTPVAVVTKEKPAGIEDENKSAAVARKDKQRFLTKVWKGFKGLFSSRADKKKNKTVKIDKPDQNLQSAILRPENLVVASVDVNTKVENSGSQIVSGSEINLWKR